MRPGGPAIGFSQMASQPETPPPELVGRGAACGDGAEADRPEAGDRDGRAVGVPQGAAEGAGGRVVGVDAPVAEVADQQIAAEGAEAAAGRHLKAPGRVQDATRGDPREEVAAGVEGVDEAEARPVDLILVPRALLGPGDVDRAAEVLDAEGPVAGRQVRVTERD